MKSELSTLRAPTADRKAWENKTI